MWQNILDAFSKYSPANILPRKALMPDLFGIANCRARQLPDNSKSEGMGLL